MSERLRLLLARHGATAWNEAGRYQGASDPPLSPAGIAHARRLAEWLADERPTQAVCAASSRARSTLEHALAHLPIPWQADPRWNEIDHGAWEGLTYAELLASHRSAALAHWQDPWHVPAPGGETLAQVAARVEAAWEVARARYQGQTLLIIASATPLQLLLCTLLETPPTSYWRWKLDLGSLSCIDLYPAGPIVNWLNRGYTPPPAC